MATIARVSKGPAVTTEMDQGAYGMEHQAAPKVPDQFADESFKLFAKIQVQDPTPFEAKKIRNKCLWRILPFLCIGYHLMYVDKQTVCFHELQQPMIYHNN